MTCVAKGRAGCLAVGTFTLFAAAGCPPQPGADPRITQIQALEDKVAQQGRTISEQDARIKSQARVIQELRGVGQPGRLDQVVRVQRIELERLSGGYDDDRDGVPEGIVLYLRLYDAEGDVVKAAGSAKARLLDLSQSEGSQLVAGGEWSAEQMRSLWYGKLLTSHYTMKIHLGPKAATLVQRSLTAVVDFTDLLSGETFSTQRVIYAPAQPQ